jgi:hypothetical protein
MTSFDPNETARRMARPIPHPTPKAVKRQDSWRTLKPEQHLKGLKPVVTPQLGFLPSGCIYRVQSVDSGGVWLNLAHPGAKPADAFRFTRTEWKEWFERVRRPPTRRKETT